MNYYTYDIPYMLNMPRQNNAFPSNATMQPFTYPSAQMMPQAVPPMQSITPALPSGIPTGPSPAPVPGAPMGTQEGVFPLADIQPAPETVQSTAYVPGFLKSQIGKRIRVEFLIGTNGPLVDRIGTLIGVGASYILIRPVDSDDIIMADLYSIKFVTVYY